MRSPYPLPIDKGLHPDLRYGFYLVHGGHQRATRNWIAVSPVHIMYQGDQARDKSVVWHLCDDYPSRYIAFREAGGAPSLYALGVQLHPSASRYALDQYCAALGLRPWWPLNVNKALAAWVQQQEDRP